MWTWTALGSGHEAPDLVPLRPSKREDRSCVHHGLERALDGVPQFTSDGLVSYEEALRRVFGKEVPYTRIFFNEKTVVSGYPAARGESPRCIQAAMHPA